MNRKWKIIAAIYIVITLPLALTGLYFLYYFVWLHHMFITVWAR